MATASLGWQGRRTTFAAGYSRSVTAGGGLIGAFNSNAANATARWQMKRAWSIGSAASYAIYQNVTPHLTFANPGGHSISGSVSVQHSIGEHFNVEAGYTRLHQSFSEIAVISGQPDTNREFISISYQFNRALGR
jgi:outer membrane protein assembly factor BamA